MQATIWLREVEIAFNLKDFLDKDGKLSYIVRHENINAYNQIR